MPICPVFAGFKPAAAPIYPGRTQRMKPAGELRSHKVATDNSPRFQPWVGITKIILSSERLHLMGGANSKKSSPDKPIK
jgi:hypothetical protein